MTRRVRKAVGVLCVVALVLSLLAAVIVCHVFFIARNSWPQAIAVVFYVVYGITATFGLIAWADS